MGRRKKGVILPVTLARRPRALQLRIEGRTYRQIATSLGVSLPTAYEAVQGALGELDATTKVLAERHRDLELQRLERATLAVWPKVQDGDERAIAAYVAIATRKAKLLGLDAPTEISATLQPMHAVVIDRLGLGEGRPDDPA